MLWVSSHNHVIRALYDLELDRPSKYMKADIVIGLSIKLRFRLL